MILSWSEGLFIGKDHASNELQEKFVDASGMRNALLSLPHVLFNTLCNENSQNLHKSTVELIPGQCRVPAFKINGQLATHQTL